MNWIPGITNPGNCRSFVRNRSTPASAALAKWNDRFAPAKALKYLSGDAPAARQGQLGRNVRSWRLWVEESIHLNQV